MMKDFLKILACTLLVASAALSAPADHPEQQVQNGNVKFAKNLYKVLAKDETGNIFFSPLSVHAAFSMVFEGAEGNTKEEFAQVLHVPSSEVAADGYDKIMGYMNDVQESTLEVANKVYLKNEYKLQDSYEQVIKEKFHSEIDLIDFEQKDSAVHTINSWAKEKTHDTIDEVLESKDINDQTTMVLINAVYFKGTWDRPFREGQTNKQTFYVDEKTEVQADMMHTKTGFYYKDSEELDAQILELPYTSEDESMIIILPKDKNGIGSVEEKIFQHENLLELIGDRHLVMSVEVSLPKFKIEKTMDLVETMQQLGLNDVFDVEKSNLSKMIEGNNLFVSKAIQKAYIEVDEKGTVASAATEVLASLGSSGLPQHTIHFEADHPFIFLLKAGDNIFFVGKVTNPVEN